MSVVSIIVVVLGAVMLGAGIWWLGAGRWRWLPVSRFHRNVTEPTRLVVGLIHLILGYHAVIWAGPPGGRERAIHIPRQHWPWVAIGCAGLIAGSVALDRAEAGVERRRSREGDPRV